MPFIIHLGDWKFKIKNEDRERLDILRQKYEGMRCQNRTELSKARDDLNKELKDITGEEILKSKCKYGSNTSAAINGALNQLIACAVTPEEKNKWELLLNEFTDVRKNAERVTAAEEKEAGVDVKLTSDNMAGTPIRYYSASVENEYAEIIQKINIAVTEDMKNVPLTGADYNNDSFRRDTMEILYQYTAGAIDGSLEEEAANSDDYLLGESINTFIPGMQDYGVGRKPGKQPYMSDYVRLEHLVPVHTPVIKALRLMNGNIAYRNTRRIKENDEFQIRDLMLSEAAEALYAIDKIRKNIANDRVRSAFSAELERSSLGSPENLEKFNIFENLHRARRQLIINGWAITDIMAVSRLASLFPTDNELLRPLNDRLNAVLNTVPGNEEKRVELINSLIQEIDKLPPEVKEQVKPLTQIREELDRAARHVLTDTEKKYLKDPAVFRDIAAAHPIREYTEAEQRKDLDWLSDIEAKDKELNDIFKTDPYAHDKIRELQAAVGNDTGIIAEAVKNVIGEKAWNDFRAKAGREKDDLKAIDILTHPDSRHNVKGNHKLLNDVEKAVRMRILDIPKKNYSNISPRDMSTGIFAFTNFLMAVSPGVNGEQAVDKILNNTGEANAARRQNEYIERLNKVLDSPGDMDPIQQRRELGSCIVGLLGPIQDESRLFSENDEIFRKENLSPEERKQLENSMTNVLGLKGGLVNKPYGDRLLAVYSKVDKALDRIEKLMVDSGHEASVINILPVKVIVKNGLKGVTTMRVLSMDPVINSADPNLRAPVDLSVDRDKNPIQPGVTTNFSFEEVEEKKDIFPIHKVITAEQELKLIWGDYLMERQKGPLSAEREKEYWDKIDSCYTTIETITNDLIAKQEESVKNHGSEGTFAAQHMRTMCGMGDIEQSFDDVISGNRGIKPKLRFISARREAVNNGWPLSELGLYSHLSETANNINTYIGEVEKVEAAKEYAEKLKELRDLLNEKITGKKYENDPSARADLYRNLSDRINWLTNEQARLRNLGSLDEGAKKAITYSINLSTDVNTGNDVGGMPLLFEIELYRKEAEIQSLEIVKNEVESLKDIADPIIYNELKEYVKENYQPPVQDYAFVDTGFNEKAELYFKSIGDLSHEINVIKQGRETTLEGKTDLSHEQAVGRIRDMLNASDSMFHFDSKQYKAVKAGLERVCSGNGTEADRQKLTEDVKQWIIDPDYDRINKHSKNEFDNTRFNLMFTLANELDPAWAKANFQDMNLSAFHGEKAADSSFYNVHEYTNFMHRQMADGGFLRGAGPISSKHWYQKSDSYGQKSLVDEVLRLREDASISQDDKLSVELSNLDKILGIGPDSRLDSEMVSALSSLSQYRNDLVSILKGDPFSDWGGERVTRITVNMDLDQLKQINIQTAKLTKQNAIKDVRKYLDNPAHRNDRMYDKVVLAYGVLDPKSAHDYIVKLNEKKIGDKKVKPISLSELEKKQGIDFGGHKALNKKKLERAAGKDTAAKNRKGPEIGA